MSFVEAGDSDYAMWNMRLKLDTSKAQDDACLFLEWRGQRFLVDFGVDNAIQKVCEWKLKHRSPKRLCEKLT